MNKILAGLAVGLLMGTSAMAADLYTPTPEYPTVADPSIDWTGFYAGVVAGYGFAEVKGTAAATTNTAENVDGALAGVTVGANKQYDQFVFGIEGDLLWSGQSGSNNCMGPGVTCAADYGWTGSLRARAGYAFDPILIYATGGLAIADITSSISPPAPGTTGSYSGTYFGWTVGAGVEAALTEQLSAKLEYAYTEFGSVTAPAGTVHPTLDTEISSTSHAIKAGLNFRF